MENKGAFIHIHKHNRRKQMVLMVLITMSWYH